MFPLQLLEHRQHFDVGVSDDCRTMNSAEQFCAQCFCDVEVVGVFVMWWGDASRLGTIGVWSAFLVHMRTVPIIEARPCAGYKYNAESLLAVKQGQRGRQNCMHDGGAARYGTRMGDLGNC